LLPDLQRAIAPMPSLLGEAGRPVGLHMRTLTPYMQRGTQHIHFRPQT
jgi:hypothetical protein